MTNIVRWPLLEDYLYISRLQNQFILWQDLQTKLACPAAFYKRKVYHFLKLKCTDPLFLQKQREKLKLPEELTIAVVRKGRNF